MRVILKKFFILIDIKAFYILQYERGEKNIMSNITVLREKRKMNTSFNNLKPTAQTGEVKGDAFNFDGTLANGMFTITEGRGTILSNWTVMKLSYTISDGNTTERITATLTQSPLAAKKK